MYSEYYYISLNQIKLRLGFYGWVPNCVIQVQMYASSHMALKHENDITKYLNCVTYIITKTETPGKITTHNSLTELQQI